MTLEQRFLVEDLITTNAMLSDAGQFEAWAATFLPDGRYHVLPRENRDQGYAIGLIACESRAVIEDRITVLRKASKFNPHVDRHILSRTQLLGMEGDIVTAHTNFMIVQSSLEGVSTLFCAGVYEDRIQITEGEAMFAERVVVLDTFSVPNLIATPV